MTDQPTGQAELDAMNVRTVVNELHEWVIGRRSHWNEFMGGDNDRAMVMGLCALADGMEVMARALYVLAIEAHRNADAATMAAKAIEVAKAVEEAQRAAARERSP